MSTMIFVRSLAFPGIFTVVFALLCCPARLSLAQTKSPASTQAPSADLSSYVNDTRHEIQPSLDVDRDPVLSPDASGNGSVPPTRIITSSKEGGSKIYTLYEDVNEVQLSCTVIDEKRHLVTDLRQDAFRVWEDGLPQTISSFQHQDAPVSMGILVDNSGSMRDKRGAVNSAALDLIRHSNPQDATFVVNFSEKIYLDQGFTSNISAIEKGLSHYDASGTTAIYDAVVASADELSSHAKWPKQVLLIITDGEDNASRLSLEQAVHRVQQLGGPVVYSIGLLYDSDNKQEMQRAKDALERLSNETGGIAYFPNKLEEVDEIANELARAIRNQYTLGYHSAKPFSLGGYRTVRVEAQASKHGRLIVRTRNGYSPYDAKATPTMQSAQQMK